MQGAEIDRQLKFLWRQQRRTSLAKIYDLGCLAMIRSLTLANVAEGTIFFVRQIGFRPVWTVINDLLRIRGTHGQNQNQRRQNRPPSSSRHQSRIARFLHFFSPFCPNKINLPCYFAPPLLFRCKNFLAGGSVELFCRFVASLNRIRLQHVLAMLRLPIPA